MADTAVEPCWIEGQTPGGWLDIGTGVDKFQPLTSTIPLVYLVSGRFVLVVNMQMLGLVPGNPAEILDPSNPRTLVRAYFADSNIPLNANVHCPFRFAYDEDASGRYVWPYGQWFFIDPCWDAPHLIGKQVRFEAELVDHDGMFAKTSKTVTVTEPVGPYMQSSPYCNP